MSQIDRAACVLAVCILAGCDDGDYHCGPVLRYEASVHRCVCPNGGEFEVPDGGGAVCRLPDGSVTPLDGMVPLGVDAGAPPERDAGAVECEEGATMPCGESDVGACELGSRRCVGGAWGACDGAIDPVEETCNDADDDCDGSTDEGVRTTYYRDADGDDYGTESDTRNACEPPSGYVAIVGDCLDTNASVHPGQETYFTTPIPGAPAATDFDYDCDGTEEKQYGSALFCQAHPFMPDVCLGTSGYRLLPGGEVPTCGERGTYQTGCAADCSSQTETRAQPCR